jgi:hypothetical protein
MRIALVFFLFTFLLSACRDEVPQQVIPDKFVRVELNLNSLEALPLKQNDQSFIYVPGGWKGIIVYRQAANDYRAFERLSPHNMNDSCAIIVHPSAFYMQDTCSKSTFDFTGMPTGGPARSAMRRYGTSFLNSFTLLITN